MCKLFASLLLCLLLGGHIQSAYSNDWTGFYFGGHVGRGWSSEHWKYLNANPYDATGPDQPILGTKNKFGSSVVVGGAQTGFNIQWSQFLLGVEGAITAGDFSETRLNVAQGVAPLAMQRVKTDIPYVAMGMGRMGWVFLPDWLLYAKGGYAGAKIKTRGRAFPSIDGLSLDWDTSKWHNGWIVGAGLEYLVGKSITVGLEYNYISLDKLTHVGAVSGGAIGPENQVVHSVDANVQTVLVRVNFLIW